MDHDWDYLTDYCKGCGMPYFQFFEEQAPPACANDDNKSWLLVRHRMSALTDPVLENLGFRSPEVQN